MLRHCYKMFAMTFIPTMADCHQTVMITVFIFNIHHYVLLHGSLQPCRLDVGILLVVYRTSVKRHLCYLLYQYPDHVCISFEPTFCLKSTTLGARGKYTHFESTLSEICNTLYSYKTICIVYRLHLHYLAQLS